MEPETTPDGSTINAVRPPKARQPKAARKVFVYRMMDGKPREFGSFPEAVVGEPLERRLLPFLKEMNVDSGDYKIEIRKPNGHFERSYEFSIAEMDDDDRDSRKVIDIEPEIDGSDLEDFSDFDTGQLSRAEVENMLLRDELKRLKDGAARQGVSGQSEMQTLINALEQSRQEQRELMLMIIQNAQKPQQDATTQAMNILEKSLGIVTKAKAISEEIAPSEQGGSGGGFMADGAKLIDSLGRNAGTFLPLLSGLIPKPQTPTPQAAAPVNRTPAPFVSDYTPAGELGNLAAKIRDKQAATAETNGTKIDEK